MAALQAPTRADSAEHSLLTLMHLSACLRPYPAAQYNPEASTQPLLVTHGQVCQSSSRLWCSGEALGPPHLPSTAAHFQLYQEPPSSCAAL